MHLGAVTVTGINAGATSTMIVIFRFVVPAIDGKLTILRKFMSVLARSVFAVFILTLIGILGITAPIMGICACCFNTVPTILVGEFAVSLENAGVHHADLDSLPMEAERVGRGGLHGLEAPVGIVFCRFEGLPGCIQLSVVLGYKTRITFIVGCLSTGRHHESGNGNGNGTLRGLALRGVMFVSDDVLLMGSTPLGLVNAIHLRNSKYIWS